MVIILRTRVHEDHGAKRDRQKMTDLRSCLFTRQIFDTMGNTVGSIRVEFIPKLHKSDERRRVAPLRRDKSKWAIEVDESVESVDDDGDSTEEL